MCCLLCCATIPPVVSLQKERGFTRMHLSTKEKVGTSGVPSSHAYTIFYPFPPFYVHRIHLHESWSNTGNPTHSLFPLLLSPPSFPSFFPLPLSPPSFPSLFPLPPLLSSFLPDGYGVMLDHRHLRTPLRRKFVIPSEPLALAVAQEWNAQGTFVQPQLMHLVSESGLIP